MSRLPQLPGFLLKSDMLMRGPVRVISNEVFAGSLVLPLGYCSARVVLTCTARVCVKLDTLKRSPEAHLVEKVISDPASAYVHVCEAHTEHIWIDICACM